jgi:beta-ureidopropionase / N-carbamoyl-L-amino-acid hydrolase
VTAAPRVDGDRLWGSLMELARIGDTGDGGCRRLALTDEDRDALDVFAGWAREAGCSIAQDEVGNLFAERPGADRERPPVLIGSHLDTQPTGGRFDGALGALAALEVVRTLDDHEIRTQAPVVVVSWTNEEGARFPQPCTGSGVFAGVLTLEQALGQRAVDGPSFGEELDRLGMAGPERAGAREFGAYFELHIEQGPIVESGGCTVGIVTGSQGLCGIAVRLTGREAHTGTTPMDKRADALVGAARLVSAVNELPAQRPGTLATVSRLEAHPGSRSTIPGRVEMVVDVRNPEPEGLAAAEAEVGRLAQSIAAEAGLDAEVETFLKGPPERFDTGCVDAVRAAAELLGHPATEIVSGAGHDAVYVARTTPTAMIFIPCRDGISHSPAEYAEPADVRAGADVLLHATLATAGVA